MIKDTCKFFRNFIKDFETCGGCKQREITKNTQRRGVWVAHQDTQQKINQLGLGFMDLGAGWIWVWVKQKLKEAYVPLLKKRTRNTPSSSFLQSSLSSTLPLSPTFCSISLYMNKFGKGKGRGWRFIFSGEFKQLRRGYRWRFPVPEKLFVPVLILYNFLYPFLPLFQIKRNENQRGREQRRGSMNSFSNFWFQRQTIITKKTLLPLLQSFDGAGMIRKKLVLFRTAHCSRFWFLFDIDLVRLLSVSICSS